MLSRGLSASGSLGSSGISFLLRFISLFLSQEFIPGKILMQFIEHLLGTKYFTCIHCCLECSRFPCLELTV